METEELKNQTAEAAEELKNQAAEAADEVKEQAAETASDVKDSAEDLLKNMKEKAEDVINDISENETVKAVREKVEGWVSEENLKNVKELFARRSTKPWSSLPLMKPFSKPRSS